VDNNNTNTRLFVQVLMQDWDHRENEWDPEIVAMSYDLKEWSREAACEEAHLFIAGEDLNGGESRAWVEVREVEWIDPPKPARVSPFKGDEIPF
jgi:hypothetical protein